MPYHYLEDVALADAAFEAWGETLEEMLVSAADATLNIMVANLDAVRPHVYRHFRAQEAQVDMLLFQLLQELIYYKDAERLLLRIKTLQIEESESGWTAFAEAAGERIDPERHDLIVDVKAVTFYRFKVERSHRGWNATVVVDV